MSTITAYRTAPQSERKAQAELREAGIKAYVPTENKTRRYGHHIKRTVKVPVAPGYVFANSKPAFAKHVKARVGDVARDDLAQFYKSSRPIKPSAIGPRYAEGDRVQIKVGQFADVIGTIFAARNNLMYLVMVPMFGKDCLIALPERNMHRLIDPG